MVFRNGKVFSALNGIYSLSTEFIYIFVSVFFKLFIVVLILHDNSIEMTKLLNFSWYFICQFDPIISLVQGKALQFLMKSKFIVSFRVLFALMCVAFNYIPSSVSLKLGLILCHLLLRSVHSPLIPSSFTICQSQSPILGMILYSQDCHLCFAILFL